MVRVGEWRCGAREREGRKRVPRTGTSPNSRTREPRLSFQKQKKKRLRLSCKDRVDGEACIGVMQADKGSSSKLFHQTVIDWKDELEEVGHSLFLLTLPRFSRPLSRVRSHCWPLIHTYSIYLLLVDINSSCLVFDLEPTKVGSTSLFLSFVHS